MADLPDKWLARAAAEHPAATALIHDGEAWDYRRLAQRVTALEARLIDLGVPQGSVLASRSDNTLLTTLLLHAALRGAITLQPLDPRLPNETYTQQLQRAGADTLVEEEPQHATAWQSLSAATLLQDTNNGDTLRSQTKTIPDPVSLIIATSGSSGTPKGVMLNAANLAAAVTASREHLPLRPGDRWLACLPLFHIGGLSILLRAVQAAATVVLHSRFDAARVWQALHEGVTHLSLVPAMLAGLLEVAAGRRPPATLRVVLIGGAALSPALRQRALSLGWPLCISYGMSETASQVATRCLGGEGNVGSLGRPLRGVTLQLLDSEGRPGATEGRVRLRGPMVMAGYANPGLRPGDGLEDGWFTTGDIGRLTPEGELEIAGRADDLLVSGGENIHPQQVEALLAPFPALQEVGVIGLPDPVWGVIVTAVVVGNFELATLQRWCEERLSGPLKPRAFLQVAALPRTASGKLDRHALFEMALAAQPSAR